jgi:hypothetical protein
VLAEELAALYRQEIGGGAADLAALAADPLVEARRRPAAVDTAAAWKACTKRQLLATSCQLSVKSKALLGRVGPFFVCSGPI